MYLITNSENKTWRGQQWNINATHVENNDNYHFLVYKNIFTTLFMYPAYEGDVENPVVWKGEGEELSKDWGIFKTYQKFTTTENVKVTFPTEEQSMIFGFITTLTIVQNNLFNQWAIKFLKKEDQTPETANEMLKKIKETQNNVPDSSAYALVAGIENKNFRKYAAYAAHRAWHDSLYRKAIPIDLEQIAYTSITLPLQDVLNILS